MCPINAINLRSPPTPASVDARAGELAQPPPAKASRAAKPEVQPLPVQPDRAAVEAAVGRLRDMAAVMDIKLNFEVTGARDRVVVRVLNGDTGKVIREIPPKEVVRLADRMAEMNQGLLLDSMA